MSEELLQDINREATRRMTALVAPQASEAHGPAVLRLSMGPLFEEVDPHIHAPCAWKYTVVSLFCMQSVCP